jgi:Zn-dependent metalloprotease
VTNTPKNTDGVDPQILAFLTEQAQSSLAAFNEAAANMVPYEEKMRLQAEYEDAQRKFERAELDLRREDMRMEVARNMAGQLESHLRLEARRREVSRRRKEKVRLEQLVDAVKITDKDVIAFLTHSYEATELLTDIDGDLGFDIVTHLSDLSTALSVAFHHVSQKPDSPDVTAQKMDIAKYQVRVEGWKDLYR